MTTLISVPENSEQTITVRCQEEGVEAMNSLMQELRPGPATFSCRQVEQMASAVCMGTLPQKMLGAMHWRWVQAALLVCMGEDPVWGQHEASPARRVGEWCLSGPFALSEADSRRCGRVDEALLVEALEPVLSAELLDYFDFCAWRTLSGQTELRAWMNARLHGMQPARRFLAAAGEARTFHVH